MAKEELLLRVIAGVWIRDRERRGELRGRSVNVEAGRIRLFVETYADRTPSSLSRADLLTWQADIGHLAAATRRQYIGAVRRFLRWLLADGLIKVDLTVHLAKVREPRRAPRALRHADVVRVLGSCPVPSQRYRSATWLRPATLLMVGCGLRCVEVSRLDVDDYDPIDRTVFVRGKGDHERILPVPDQTAEALAEYLAGRRPGSGPLFRAVGSKQNPDGRLSAKWISKRTGRLMAAAGVHLQAWDRRTAHALRHTAATDVLERCHNVLLVQQMLGHESLETTQIYLGQADVDQLRQAMEGRTYLSRPA